MRALLIVLTVIAILFVIGVWVKETRNAFVSDSVKEPLVAAVLSDNVIIKTRHPNSRYDLIEVRIGSGWLDEKERQGTDYSIENESFHIHIPQNYSED